MALVAHYDLELHQMNVKTAFLNRDLEDNVYMDQPMGFSVEGNEHMVCKLKKSIYSLKQASRQRYLKFNDTIVSFGFKENIIDLCIYLKVSGSKVIFLILCVGVRLFNLAQCPRNDMERKQMKAILYASVVVASTMKAKFVACFEATIQANLLWNFISRLEIIDSIAKPLKMYCDNSATICFLRMTSTLKVLSIWN